MARKPNRLAALILAMTGDGPEVGPVARTVRPARADPAPEIQTLPGRDHRSLLLFLHSVEANNGGNVRAAATHGCMPGSSRMRDKTGGKGVRWVTDGTDGSVASVDDRLGLWRDEFGTRYDGGGKDPHHDDWDCLWDLEKWGFVICRGTGLHPIVSLTDKGHALVAPLVRARAAAQRGEQP